jgi:hypothetical protein
VNKRILIVGIAAVVASLGPAAAKAQSLPPYAQPAPASAQPPPPYASGQAQLTGRVAWFQPFHLQLNKGPHIYLHQGTVINPTGLTLEPGMPVQVYGHISPDGTFQADEIDLLPPPRIRRARYVPFPPDNGPPNGPPPNGPPPQQQ